MEKEKIYKIKIPVFTTTPMNDTIGLFGIPSYKDMIDMLSRRIKESELPYNLGYRNKKKNSY